ncbi:atrial natriuretic peptide receptor 2-like [Ruditapes philippinarum]|uniref:atrial natriuretic peptide receptor 2-like n=1 Tax=Ruditapes philippinarum TaxID=129788 RepID=UPI00295B19BC|nr:atrial natriuretic peptide receptor 2-like [Ruditapes philippinarum]
MTSYTLFILLLFARVRICENFKIGLLLTTRAPSPGFPTIFTSGGAFQLALEEINNRYKTSVDYIWNNTDCDVTRALLTGYEQGTQGNVDVIVGPACEKSMDLVTRLMSVLKSGPVPTFTWLPRKQSSSFPNDTAISTYPSYETIANSFVVLLKHFSWKKIGIIAAKDEICGSLIETVNDLFPNKDLSIIRLKFMTIFTQQSIVSGITEVKDHARVILLCMKPEYVRQFLVEADALGFTSKEFVFIYCRFGPSPETGLLQPGTDNKIFKSLLQIGFMSNNLAQVSNFTSTAAQKWFDNCTSMATQMGFNKLPMYCNETDEFSMSLYDTLLFSADMYFNNPQNGTFNYSNMARTIQTFSGTKAFDSSGKIIRKATLVYFQNGDFETVATVTDIFLLNKPIKWPGGTLPADSPDCGWTGDQCSTDDSVSNKNSVIIGSCVSLAVILIIGGALYACYRKSKFEKDLLNMIWKVNNNEIKLRRPRAPTQNSLQDKNNSTHHKKTLTRMDTRGTLGLGSTSSIDKTILFAPVGNYKGSIVAVKNIQRRSIQLNREMLRDLKSLRELQHENLNPFIGVSLEPGNSYILMKYCSKGSLQDVLENDDIKLDNMFKMSFLMDLGRGLDFLHKSPVRSHGNLKSSNCVIDSRWVLKLTDYGALCIPPDTEPTCNEEDNEYYSTYNSNIDKPSREESSLEYSDREKTRDDEIDNSH